MSKAIVPKRPLVIVATTPDDSHAWNLIGIELHLAERGFEVLNLGPCTPEELLAETIRDQRPDLVVLSSINGHGALSLPAVLETLEHYQVKRTAPIVIGGLLTTDPKDTQAAATALTEVGAAGVFTGPQAWKDFDDFLRGQRTKQNTAA